MTKMDTLHYILNYDLKPLSDRLNKLVDEDRITTGACYYVYSPYSFYSLKEVMELTSKAAASKDYIRYIKRVKSSTFNYLLKDFKADIARTEAFLAEQEALPFEQSQKQVLIQKGEL